MTSGAPTWPPTPPALGSAPAKPGRSSTLLVAGVLLDEARGHGVLVAAEEADDGHLLARAERLADPLADLLHVHAHHPAVVGLQAQLGPVDRADRAVDPLPRLLVHRPRRRRRRAGGRPRRRILLDIARDEVIGPGAREADERHGVVLREPAADVGRDLADVHGQRAAVVGLEGRGVPADGLTLAMDALPVVGGPCAGDADQEQTGQRYEGS